MTYCTGVVRVVPSPPGSHCTTILFHDSSGTFSRVGGRAFVSLA